MPASGSSADGALRAWRASAPAEMVSYDRSASHRPKPSPTPTATPTASPSSPAPTVACAYPTSSFNGAAYCPATIVGVRDTIYGIGTRVVLKSVTVTEVKPSTVTVAVGHPRPARRKSIAANC